LSSVRLFFANISGAGFHLPFYCSLFQQFLYFDSS